MIYFIQCGKHGPIKIGHANNPENRLSQLQTGHHEKLSLVLVLPGGFRQESDIHKMFAAYRLSGEWFSPAAALIEFVTSRITPKRRGRYWGAPRKKSRRLSQSEVIAIFIEMSAGNRAVGAAIARKYSITPDTVGLIARGRTHDHLFVRTDKPGPAGSKIMTITLRRPESETERNARVNYIADPGRGYRRFG